jgi:hypothetical protein
MFTLKLRNKQLSLVKSYATKTSRITVRTKGLESISVSEFGSRMANFVQTGKKFIMPSSSPVDPPHRNEALSAKEVCCSMVLLIISQSLE